MAVGVGDGGCSTCVCAGLGATEANAVPEREYCREEERDLDPSRGETEVAYSERPKKPLLTFNFWPTKDSVNDVLSANVVPTAEPAETPLERVAIFKLVPLYSAKTFLEKYPTRDAGC